jgi:glycosyltransferase involved in cell wall biosynthesis
MPTVTIGVPVYNGHAYLAEALQSLCDQTFEDREIVISDNASTDDTAEICQSFARRDTRIRYFRQPRTIPPAENHNFVLDQARGRYFKWATYDDVCGPQFLERCIAVLERDPSAVLCHPRTAIIDETGRPIEDYEYPLATGSASVARRFGSLLRADHRRYAAFEIYGVMRTDALRRLPEMGNYVSGDRVLLTRLVLLGRFAQIEDRLFFSREHATRSVRTVSNRVNRGRRWLRQILGVGPLPPLEWWDPTKRGVINFPEWRLVREYIQSLDRASLTPAERLSCFAELARWFFGDVPKLVRDLLLACEQAMTKLPAAREVSRT